VNAEAVNVVETQLNIRAAIRRSRRAREKIARRRRRTAIAASALIAAAFPLSFAAFGVSGSDVVHAARNGAQNLSDLLNRRAPGARTTALLTKTKKPQQHALAKLRDAAPPLAPSPIELAKILLPAEQAPAIIPIALLQAGPPLPLSAIIGPSPGGVGSLPGGVIVSPPGGSGGGSPPGGGPTTTPTTVPKEVPPVSPVPSAVPEPGTWATMLLGFGLLGWRFRRERKVRPPARSSLTDIPEID
jgi:hypothetical protein